MFMAEIQLKVLFFELEAPWLHFQTPKHVIKTESWQHDRDSPFQ